MKKIYSKITKERQKQFRIETYITKDEDTKLVVKKALTEECRAHIRGMYDYYEKHKDSNVLCPSKMISDCEIAFDFLRGESLCNEMLEALEEKDEVKFLSLLKIYDQIIRKNVQIEKKVFAPDKAFEEIFGKASFTQEIECAKELNIDMTFDNIIRESADDDYRTIDYEWVFPFQIPLKFVIYRAVLAFYTRNASAMNDTITLDEIYKCFDITLSETEIFEQMNHAFNDYVYGGSQGYNASLQAYKKEVYDVKKLLPEDNLFLQLFLGDGTDYVEEHAITKRITGKRVHMLLTVADAGKAAEIRLDPLNVSSVLSNVKVSVLTKNHTEFRVEHYRHNAIITKDGDFIFTSEDPQIIFTNEWGENLKEVRVSFDIREAGLLDHPMITALDEMKNELEYIKGTKTYKMFLEHKVDKVLGEDK